MAESTATITATPATTVSTTSLASGSSYADCSDELTVNRAVADASRPTSMISPKSQER